MNRGSNSRNIRVRSISVEDLGSMTKRMIGGALDDTGLIAKLHRDIYEDLWYEKSTELEGYEFNDNSVKASSQMTHEPANVQRDESKKYSKEDTNSLFMEEKNNEEEDFVSSHEGKNQNITNVTSASMTLKNKSFIENEARTETPEMQRQGRKSTNEETEKIEEPFEIWKREKTKAIRRMLKEERNKREQELAAKQMEIEKKRAAHQAYLNWKKQQASQRKFEEMQKRTMRDSCLEMQKTRMDEKNVANEETFRAWERQKDRQSQQRLCQSGRGRIKTQNIRHSNEIEFDSWLDRLDSVLHNKYLRERRYLVRSFYCQPTYYGRAALSKS